MTSIQATVLCLQCGYATDSDYVRGAVSLHHKDTDCDFENILVRNEGLSVPCETMKA